jgi:hypothetical protein
VNVSSWLKKRSLTAEGETAVNDLNLKIMEKIEENSRSPYIQEKIQNAIDAFWCYIFYPSMHAVFLFYIKFCRKKLPPK